MNFSNFLKTESAMTKRKTAQTEDKTRKPRKADVFDQDHAWKNFIEKDIFSCIAATNPKLYIALDKSVPPEFLEQEMSNIIRGKYKIRGKEKKSDKLVKLRLLTGENCIIYVHFEVQDKLEDDFPERIFTYRCLIALRYNTQKITTIVIFTGKSPSEKYKIFKDECFDSEVMYQYNSYVIADQDIELLEKSDNLFDLGVLAAKYTLDTEGDARKRIVFKKKLSELAFNKGFSFEKTEQLISFVFDYMLLPENMENEFQSLLPNYLKLNPDKMVATRGEKQFKSTLIGKIFEEFRAELAQKEAERAKLLAEKEAEKEAMRQKTIHNFLSLNVSIEKIAEMMELDLEYVSKIVNDKLSTESK